MNHLKARVGSPDRDFRCIAVQYNEISNASEFEFTNVTPLPCLNGTAEGCVVKNAKEVTTRVR